MARGLKPEPEDQPAVSAMLAAFGARVKETRKRAGLTLEEVGEAAALSKSYVFQIEAGRSNLTLEGVWRLARALRVGMRDLVPEGELDRPAVADLREETSRVAAALEGVAAAQEGITELRGHVLALVSRLDRVGPRPCRGDGDAGTVGDAPERRPPDDGTP